MSVYCIQCKRCEARWSFDWINRFHRGEIKSLEDRHNQLNWRSTIRHELYINKEECK